MGNANIIDVSEETFDFEVLNYSTHVPVVVDLWAPWCIPCRVQSELLAKLADEADGAFRLARINVDEQSRLAKRLKVNDLPGIKAFVDGRMVAEYIGVLSEKNTRLFLDRIMPKTGGLLLAKGKSLILLGEYEEAEIALEQFIIESHGESAGLLAYARALLFQGKARPALDILEHFPTCAESESAGELKILAQAYLLPELDQLIFEDMQESAFRNALRMAKKGKVLIALDGLLGVLQKDKNHRDGLTKEIFLGLLELLSDDHPSTRQYRSDLSNALF
ncbi:MAG: tetratricopeptide repeat protein [Anaerolineaceae bacterium]|jgi:putative thioredoxin